MLFLASKMHKSVGGRGFAPDPTGEAYSAPQDHLAGLEWEEGSGQSGSL